MYKRNLVQAIIQARVGSSRLPSKIFETIGENSILKWVIKNLHESDYIKRIVIATTCEKEDDAVEKFCHEEGVNVFRGSEEDVLDRFYKTLGKYPCDILVRATADNPLLHIETLDSMVKLHINENADYTSIEGVAPLGLTAEIVTSHALKKAWDRGNEKAHREHVTPFIYEHPDEFTIKRLEPPASLAGKNYRLTVDTKEDLDLMKAIYKKLYSAGKEFTANNAVALLSESPALLQLNSHIRQRGARG